MWETTGSRAHLSPVGWNKEKRNVENMWRTVEDSPDVGEVTAIVEYVMSRCDR